MVKLVPGALAVAGFKGSDDPATAKQHKAQSSLSVVAAAPVSPASPEDERKDYYVSRDGVQYAGTHLIVDLVGASNLDRLDLVERALREAATVSGATILNCDLHHFEPNGGISGVVVLAESHISIHTWPERNFAALDIFMCGACNPYNAIPVLKEAFRPSSVMLTELKRGLVV